MSFAFARRRAVGVATSAGMLAATALLLIGVSGGARSAHATTPLGAADRFAIFRRPAVSSDAAPDGSASDSTHLSRKIDSGDTTWEQWAQADPGQICVASYNGEQQPSQLTPARACAPDQIVASSYEPLIMESVKGHDRRLSGLVPDGVSSVTVGYADGTSQSAAIQDNGFHLKLAEKAWSLSYDAPDGTHTAPGVADGE